MPVVRTKRVYDAPSADDGIRVLVDRLWPRGLSKDKARVDEWMKEIAPSPALRTWFHAHPDQWDRFQEDYLAEARSNPALATLRTLAGKRRVTLVYAYRDEQHNHAGLLAGLLKAKPRRKAGVRES